MYIDARKRNSMRVSNWENSLAIRLPAAVVEALDLKEGDDIEIRVAGKRTSDVSRDTARQQALARRRKLRRNEITETDFES
jgi:antitoxin MazE